MPLKFNIYIKIYDYLASFHLSHNEQNSLKVSIQYQVICESLGAIRARYDQKVLPLTRKPPQILESKENLKIF